MCPLCTPAGAIRVKVKTGKFCHFCCKISNFLSGSQIGWLSNKMGDKNSMTHLLQESMHLPEKDSVGSNDSRWVRKSSPVLPWMAAGCPATCSAWWTCCPQSSGRSGPIGPTSRNSSRSQPAWTGVDPGTEGEVSFRYLCKNRGVIFSTLGVW